MPEKENRESPRQDVNTLERGNIFFFYRPRVEEEAPESIDDVQRFHMVLRPENRQVFRLLVVGQKKLPDPSRGGGGNRAWGYVEAADTQPNRIRDRLRAETYQTRTRGERHQPAARPIGEGVYRIVRHGDHTHFVYALELPRRKGEAQEEFNVQDEASYIITVKNPAARSPPRAGLSPKQNADYPSDLIDKFRDRRFAEADPPEFLDYEGTEFILIPAAENVDEELGIDLQPQDESESTAEIFTELELDQSEHPLEPLFEGRME
jgi:hypothetical protein